MTRKVDIKMVEERSAGDYVGNKLANLPEEFALWLVWRRTINEPVSASVVADVTKDLVCGYRITAPMVNNFFSLYYGIGGLEMKKFKDIYTYLSDSKTRKKDKLRVYPPVEYPGDTKVNMMIQRIEDLIGESADLLIKKNRSR